MFTLTAIAALSKPKTGICYRANFLAGCSPNRRYLPVEFRVMEKMSPQKVWDCMADAAPSLSKATDGSACEIKCGGVNAALVFCRKRGKNRAFRQESARRIRRALISAVPALLDENSQRFIERVKTVFRRADGATWQMRLHRELRDVEIAQDGGMQIASRKAEFAKRSVRWTIPLIPLKAGARRR